MFWMRNKENDFPIHTLIWRPDLVYAKEYHNKVVCMKVTATFIPKIFKTSNPDQHLLSSAEDFYKQLYPLQQMLQNLLFFTVVDAALRGVHMTHVHTTRCRQYIFLSYLF